MDAYILHPPAQDSATAGYSSAAKGGLAGCPSVAFASSSSFRSTSAAGGVTSGVVLEDYGKEQDMGIEALEAMLMDDKFREIHSSESGLNTCNHRFKISISPQVRLADCSSWCCVFSVPRSLVMFLCYAPSVMLFWILSSSSFL
uniref:Uncharacterized protein n=1 Tax=Populus trichocarpa TaxID=3694 RepID=U7DVT3_POPTR